MKRYVSVVFLLALWMLLSLGSLGFATDYPAAERANGEEIVDDTWVNLLAVLAIFVALIAAYGVWIVKQHHRARTQRTPLSKPGHAEIPRYAPQEDPDNPFATRSGDASQSEKK